MAEVRKGQGDVTLTREEFERRLRERFYDPAFERVAGEVDAGRRRRLGRLRRVPQEPAHAESGARLRRPGLRAAGRVARGARRASSAAQRRSRTHPAAARASCWSAAPRATTRPARARCRRPSASSQMAREEIERAGVTCDLLDLSLLTAEYGRQILPCKACVSTAMPLCHWPCSCYPNHAHGPGQRLDERDLPALGRRARRDDRHAGLLVPGAERAQADDRSAGLRRRRQSRSDDDARQEAGGGQGARAGGLGLSAAPRRPALLGRRARRRRGRREPAADR